MWNWWYNSQLYRVTFDSYTQLTDVVGLPGNQPPLQVDHLDGIQTDLKDVVDESQQGGEGERCHKYCCETELNHWRGWTVS